MFSAFLKVNSSFLATAVLVSTVPVADYFNFLPLTVTFKTGPLRFLSPESTLPVDYFLPSDSFLLLSILIVDFAIEFLGAMSGVMG